MRIRCVLTDIDGTLLNPRHEVSSRMARAVRRLKELGVPLVLVSARPPMAMEGIREKAGADPVMLCCAGALVTRGREVLSRAALPLEAVQTVCRLAAARGASVNLYAGFRWYALQRDKWTDLEEGIVGFGPEIMPAAELLKMFEQQGTGPEKILVIAEEDAVAALCPALQTALDGRARLTLSKNNYLEILPMGADKGAAAEQYLRARGILREEAVGCGDQDVDIPLLKACGTAVAMANGSDNVKRHADIIAPSNAEDGLAQVLERLAERL